MWWLVVGRRWLGRRVGSRFKYVRVGSAADVAVKTEAGFALMGGGTDLDEAFRWMCGHSGGGDFLICAAMEVTITTPMCRGFATRILSRRW